MDEAKEKVETFVDKCLKKYKLDFTYGKVTVEKCKYYGPGDYEMELLFHEYNGGKYPHRCRIYCMYGVRDVTMYLDMGFPSAALSYDRVSIPVEAIEELAQAAYYDTEFAKLRKKNSK